MTKDVPAVARARNLISNATTENLSPQSKLGVFLPGSRLVQDVATQHNPTRTRGRRQASERARCDAARSLQQLC